MHDAGIVTEVLAKTSEGLCFDTEKTGVTGNRVVRVPPVADFGGRGLPHGILTGADHHLADDRETAFAGSSHFGDRCRRASREKDDEHHWHLHLRLLKRATSLPQI